MTVQNIDSNQINNNGSLNLGSGVNKWTIVPLELVNSAGGKYGQLTIMPLNSAGVADSSKQFTFLHDTPEIFKNVRIVG